MFQPSAGVCVDILEKMIELTGQGKYILSLVLHPQRRSGSLHTQSLLLL